MVTSIKTLELSLIRGASTSSGKSLLWEAADLQPPGTLIGEANVGLVS